MEHKKTTTPTTSTPDGEYLFELGANGMLGSGAHGVVRLARHKHTHEIVAVKVMPVSQIAPVATELAAYGLTRHPNIIELRSTSVDLDRKRVYMVMELACGGELFDRIAECGQLDEPTARRYLYEMADALAYCHARNIYHRDLKPENVLLTNDDKVKLCDFGLAAMWARVHDDATYLRHTKCGSLMYAAPEVLTSSADVGYEASSADVWSLGVIFYAMLAGALPFQVANEGKCRRYAAAKQNGFRATCEANGFSEEAVSLLCAMLQPDPALRCSIQSVLDSDFLQPHRAAAEEEAAAAGGVAAATGSQAVGKWCELLGSPANPSPAKRQRMVTPATAVAAPPQPSMADEDTIRPGAGEVNKQLTRSLGWVALPKEKEKVVEDVASVLKRLGADLSVVRGELTDVVIASLPAEADGVESTPEVVEAAVEGAQAVAEAGGGTAMVGAEGRLTVRMQVRAGSDSTAEFDMSRGSGPVLQFHSLYRDVRNQLAGLNGWSEDLGRYVCEAHSSKSQKSFKSENSFKSKTNATVALQS